MLTRDSFHNGIACAMAMGCSTNAIIHLIAMSRRAGHASTLDDFDAASRQVPVIANIRPSGERYLMEDFFYAGGLPAMLQTIRGHLKTAAMTVNGCTLGDNIDGSEVHDDDVIRPLDRPIYAEGALAVLRGNTAPDGVVIKPSACAPRLLRHTGRALVFDDYPSLKKAVEDPQLDVTADDILELALRRAQGRACRNGACCRSRQAAEGRRHRHAAAERCAHERHQLRRLPAALRAGSGGRRPARAAAHRGPISVDVPARRIHLEVSDDQLAARARLGGTGAALGARLRLGLRPACAAGRPGLRLRLPGNRLRRRGARPDIY